MRGDDGALAGRNQDGRSTMGLSGVLSPLQANVPYSLKIREALRAGSICRDHR
jgi:hypothetical protein